MIIQIECHRCSAPADVEVNPEGYRLWKSGGELIQRALPDLSISDRELLISQTCAKCWDEMYLPDEDDDWPDDAAF